MIKRIFEKTHRWIDGQRAQEIFAIVCVVLSSLDFLSGYRLTWDDVNAHQTALMGAGSIWEYVLAITVFQGRIGHLVSAPFSMYSALFADELWFRILNVTFYFAMIYLLYKYLDIVLKTNVKTIALLLTVALHPLAYFHLPPNSYGLFISFPATLILSWRLLKGGHRFKTLPLIIRGPASIVVFLCTLSSEYMIVFHLILIALELFAKKREYPEQKFGNFILANYDRTGTLIFFLAIVSNLIFRVLNPSKYDGVSLNSTFDLFATLNVMVLHPIWGLSPPHVLLEWITNRDFWPSVPRLAFALLLAFTTFLLTRKAIANYSDSSKIIRRILLLFGATLLTALPLSLTLKYQTWCVLSGCAYIDSRFESFYIIFALSIGAPWALSQIKNSKLRSKLVLVFSVIVAISVLATSIGNAAVAKRMQTHSQSFEKVRLIPCLETNNLNISQVKGLIDPVGSVTATDINSYWNLRLKLAMQEKSEVCSNLTQHQKYLIGQMNDAVNFWETTKNIEFNNSKSRLFLGDGWSYTETWGVWSTTTSPEIYLDLNSKNISYLELDFIPFKHPFGELRAYLGDTQVLSESLTKLSGKEAVKIYLGQIPEPLKKSSSVLKLEFEENQTSLGMPIQLKDNRNLGIGAISLRLQD